MMDVRDLLKFNVKNVEERVLVSGILVCFEETKGRELRLINSNPETPWQDTDYVKLADPDLYYAFMMQLFLEGGGDSIFFHDSIVFGKWDGNELTVEKIKCVRSSVGDSNYLDISSEIITMGRKRYGHFDNLPPEELDLFRR